MDCRDLMRIEQIRDGMKLVAGEAGVRRSIRWIYFADCVQCLKENVNLPDLIHGQELVIVTDETLTADDATIISMIRTMMRKNIAGVVINEGQISQAVIQYCNEAALPLFELSVRLHLVDVSQTICRMLIEEEDSMNLRAGLLSSILYDAHADYSELKYQAGRFGINLSSGNRIAFLKNENFGESDEPDRKAERSNELGKVIRRSLESECRANGLVNMLVDQQGSDSIFLLPGQFAPDSVREILNTVIGYLKNGYGCTVNAGIGSIYEYAADLKESYQEAMQALELKKELLPEESVCFMRNWVYLRC